MLELYLQIMHQPLLLLVRSYKMKKQYTVEQFNGQTVIWYEENGVRYSFTDDPANSDYQAYLDRDKPKAALSTPNV